MPILQTWARHSPDSVTKHLSFIDSTTRWRLESEDLHIRNHDQATGYEVVLEIKQADETYAYLAKSTPISFEAPTESVRDAMKDLHALRDIVESHVEEVASAHQSE